MRKVRAVFVFLCLLVFWEMKVFMISQSASRKIPNSSSNEHIIGESKDYANLQERLHRKSATGVTSIQSVSEYDLTSFNGNNSTIGNEYNSSLKVKSQVKTTKNIYLLRVHKTGTTTLYNIFARYALKNNLRLAIFKHVPYKSKEPDSLLKSLTPPFREGKSEKYNILLDHSRYFPDAIAKILYQPTQFIAMVRNPLTLIESYLHLSLKYIRGLHLDKEKGVSLFIEKLADPSWYAEHNETLERMRYYMSDTFMIEPHQRAKLDTFRQLGKVFFVGIKEYYDESIILMRRHLGLNFQDVLYSTLNVQGYKHKELNQTLYKTLCSWMTADCQLYEYFNQTFWHTFNKEGEDILSEVNHFKMVQTKIAEFCSPVFANIENENYVDTTKQLQISASPWNTPFVYTSRDCALSRLHPWTFRPIFYFKQNPDITCGENYRCPIISDLHKICRKICHISKSRDIVDEIIKSNNFHYFKFD